MAIIIFLLILAVLLVIFTLQNSMEVTINVFFWKIDDAPLVLVLICCIVIGYLLAFIYFYPKIWKIKKQLKKLGGESHRINKTDAGHLEDDDPEGIDLDYDEYRND